MTGHHLDLDQIHAAPEHQPRGRCQQPMAPSRPVHRHAHSGRANASRAKDGDRSLRPGASVRVRSLLRVSEVATVSARLFLPLLAAGAPLAGLALDGGLSAPSSRRRLLLQMLVCIFLLSVARRPALENWLRPLLGACGMNAWISEGEQLKVAHAAP